MPIKNWEVLISTSVASPREFMPRGKKTDTTLRNMQRRMIDASKYIDRIQTKINELKIKLQKIEKTLQPMLKQVTELWLNEVEPALKKQNIEICKYENLSNSEREILNNYFKKEIYPVLTPLAFDPGRPFPYISNLSLSLAILVSRQNKESHFARLKIPSILPRLMQIDRIIEPDKKNQTNGKFS